MKSIHNSQKTELWILFYPPLRQILRGADRFVANSRYSRIEVNRKTQKKLRAGIFGVNFAMSKGKKLKTAKKK